MHSDDVADAYRRAVTGDVRGAFNIAADPVIGTRDGADDQTAPLAASTSGPLRVREILTGLGKRP